LSLFAFIIGALFLVAVELSKFKFELSKKNIVLFIVLATVLSGIVFYAQYRFVDQGGTEQIGYREMVVSYWLALNSVDTLLGLGAGQTVFDGSTASVLIEDASFMFKLMFEFGIFALPYLFLMLYISRGFAVVFFLIILLTKIHYQIYILWFYPAALYILWQSQEAKKARLEKKFRER
jgi:4-hydroxybenzoate polyprenyltransferase